MNNPARKEIIIGIIICIILGVLGTLWVHRVDADAPLTPPTITTTTTCLGASIDVSHWDVDPALGDEYASMNTITYLQNATLNADGDVSPSYGATEWLLDKSPLNVVTIEIDSILYHSESQIDTYLETITIPADAACFSLGNIEDVLLTPHIGTSWQATLADGTYLGTIAIANNGTWFCDEVVDVSNIGGTYSDALDTLCDDKASAFNTNTSFLPVIIK